MAVSFEKPVQLISVLGLIPPRTLNHDFRDDLSPTEHGIFLPKEIAEREVVVYEYLDWDNFTMPISVSRCHRYNATHVSCLARYELNGYLDFSRDYVSLSHGEPVVHPAGWESLLIS
jgi:hypothetical protein